MYDDSMQIFFFYMWLIICTYFISTKVNGENTNKTREIGNAGVYNTSSVTLAYFGKNIAAERVNEHWTQYQ